MDWANSSHLIYYLGVWDEMSRWAAGRYQLLVLSTHYQESSQQLVNYIENIERKVSQSADVIPECVVEKIRNQSNKAKVYTFVLFVRSLLLRNFLLFE